MNSQVSTRLLLFIFFFLSACSNWPIATSNSRCLTKRTAIDIGSGTTKMQIATVDICEQTIKGVIATSDYKIDFKEDLQSRKSQDFSPEVMQKAIVAFSEIAKQSKMHGVSNNQIRGVATAAFREAKNTGLFIEQVSKDLGVKIEVISQGEEAELGMRSVRTQIENAKEEIFVWDIGGGSMQMTFQNPNTKVFEIFEGKLASVNFKNDFIAQVQKKNSETVRSPNPISKIEAEAGILFVQKYLSANRIPEKFVEQSKVATVFGIGGVLTLSLPSQIRAQNKVIQLSDVLSTLDRQLNKTDRDLQSKYAATDVTNLILVAGFMKYLGLEKYTTAVANNTSGLLVEEKYWR